MMSLARKPNANTAQPTAISAIRTPLTNRPDHAPLWAKTVPIQFSLKINTPGDRYEQEADRIADQMMRTPASQVQRKTCSCDKPAGPDGMCEECRRKQLGIQRMASADSPQTNAPPSVHQVLQRPGRPLETPARSFMEARLGRNFGHVRVHTSGRAAESAQQVNARAYTVGSDVVFGPGEYAPHTDPGRQLLAHELTHVIQQDGGRGLGLQRRLVVSEDPFAAAPAADPARRLTSAQRFDTVDDLITDLSSDFQVNRTNGEVESTGADCGDPSQIAAGSNPVASCCLCTLVDSGPGANTWTIFVSETVFPHTSERTHHVVTPPADSAIEYGHWTAADQRAGMTRTIVLGHELCGHAALIELNAHPASADRTVTDVHDPTVRIQNEIAGEQGVPASELRGLARSGTHRGESLAQITVKQFPLNGLWTSQIVDRNERRKVHLATQLIRQNAMWVDIVGHSDPVGSESAKQNVSDQRAQQMKRTLRNLGVSERVSRRDLERQGRFSAVGAFADSRRFTQVQGVSDRQPPPAAQQTDHGNWRRVDIFMTAFPAGAENIPPGTPTTVAPVPTPVTVPGLAASANACHSLLVGRAYDIRSP